MTNSSSSVLRKKWPLLALVLAAIVALILVIWQLQTSPETNDAYVYTEVELPDGTTQEVVVRTDGRTHPARGSMLGIEAVPHHVHLFDAQSGVRL